MGVFNPNGSDQGLNDGMDSFNGMALGNRTFEMGIFSSILHTPHSKTYHVRPKFRDPQ
jgi:hypothetical protein